MSNVPLHFQKGYQQCSDLKGCVDKGSRRAQTVTQSSDYYLSRNVMTLRSTSECVFECMKMKRVVTTVHIVHITYSTYHVLIIYVLNEILWIYIEYHPFLYLPLSLFFFIYRLTSRGHSTFLCHVLAGGGGRVWPRATLVPVISSMIHI